MNIQEFRLAVKRANACKSVNKLLVDIDTLSRVVEFIDNLEALADERKKRLAKLEAEVRIVYDKLDMYV